MELQQEQSGDAEHNRRHGKRFSVMPVTGERITATSEIAELTRHQGRAWIRQVSFIRRWSG
jgi:hypothetical protein